MRCLVRCRCLLRGGDGGGGGSRRHIVVIVVFVVVIIAVVVVVVVAVNDRFARPLYPILPFGVGWPALFSSFRLVSRMVSRIVPRMASGSEALNRELLISEPLGYHCDTILESFWICEGWKGRRVEG